MLHVSNSKILHIYQQLRLRKVSFVSCQDFRGDFGSDSIPFETVVELRSPGAAQTGRGWGVPGSPICCEVDVTRRWRPGRAGVTPPRPRRPSSQVTLGPVLCAGRGGRGFPF